MSHDVHNGVGSPTAPRQQFTDADEMLYRIPGRDYRSQITHKRWSEMNRHERRLVEATRVKERR